MSEIRKDYFLDNYVIISPHRSKRPNDFKIVEKKALDVFAPRNVSLTGEDIYRFPEKGKWQIRVFSNKFPVAKPDGFAELKTDNEFFSYSNSYGNHELIIETPTQQPFANLHIKNIAKVLEVYNKRIIANLKDSEIKYVTVFKNSGRLAGASIKHSHTQLISQIIIPKKIMDAENAIAKLGYDPYEKIINIEKNSDRRCFESDNFISFTPYASAFPYEIWIFPKKFMLNLNNIGENEYFELADMLKKILLKLNSKKLDYNFYLHYGIKKMRFHFIINPRVHPFGGYELSTGAIINTISPEEAAWFYRGQKK